MGQQANGTQVVLFLVCVWDVCGFLCACVCVCLHEQFCMCGAAVAERMQITPQTETSQTDILAGKKFLSPAGPLLWQTSGPPLPWPFPPIGLAVFVSRNYILYSFLHSQNQHHFILRLRYINIKDICVCVCVCGLHMSIFRYLISRLS